MCIRIHTERVFVTKNGKVTETKSNRFMSGDQEGKRGASENLRCLIEYKVPLDKVVSQRFSWEEDQGTLGMEESLAKTSSFLVFHHIFLPRCLSQPQVLVAVQSAPVCYMYASATLPTDSIHTSHGDRRTTTR